MKSSKATKNGSKNNANNAGKLEKRFRLHETRNDLSEKVRSQVCAVLNQSLAESLDLYTQTKQAHWNVKGVHFYQLHLLFDEIAGELADYVDLFAERITSLGGTAFGTVRMAAKATELPEYPTDLSEGMDHVATLANRFATFGESLRENIDVMGELEDMVTQDIYVEVARDIDKRLWFLEAHLQADSADRETSQAHVAAKPKR
jgi:starvation-inducible DNA-binding protein